MKKQFIILCLLSSATLLAMDAPTHTSSRKRSTTQAKLTTEPSKKCYRAAIRTRDFQDVMQTYRGKIKRHSGNIMYAENGIMPFCYILAPESIVKDTFDDPRIASLKLLEEKYVKECKSLDSMYVNDMCCKQYDAQVQKAADLLAAAQQAVLTQNLNQANS